jgi:hypothetical protein
VEQDQFHSVGWKQEGWEPRRLFWRLLKWLTRKEALQVPKKPGGDTQAFGAGCYVREAHPLWTQVPCL